MAKLNQNNSLHRFRTMYTTSMAERLFPNTPLGKLMRFGDVYQYKVVASYVVARFQPKTHFCTSFSVSETPYTPIRKGSFVQIAGQRNLFKIEGTKYEGEPLVQIHIRHTATRCHTDVQWVPEALVRIPRLFKVGDRVRHTYTYADNVKAHLDGKIVAEAYQPGTYIGYKQNVKLDMSSQWYDSDNLTLLEGVK